MQSIPTFSFRSCAKALSARSAISIIAALLLAVPGHLFSQSRVYHFVYANASMGLDKKMYSGGYSVGYRRVIYGVSYGIADGTDRQFLPADQIDNNKLKGELSSSAVVEPDFKPAGSYLEEVNSVYTGPQARFGITCFLRRNDTLGRKAFSGPHAGIAASYMIVSEQQTVTYKSETSEQRWSYYGENKFRAFGAASHIGWQFALLHERLYLNAQFVVPFLYPFTDDPNINSPFAGTKYEVQVSAAWHIGWKRNDKETESDPKAKVRDKI